MPLSPSMSILKKNDLFKIPSYNSSVHYQEMPLSNSMSDPGEEMPLSNNMSNLIDPYSPNMLIIPDSPEIIEGSIPISENVTDSLTQE